MFVHDGNILIFGTAWYFVFYWHIIYVHLIWYISLYIEQNTAQSTGVFHDIAQLFMISIRFTSRKYQYYNTFALFVLPNFRDTGIAEVVETPITLRQGPVEIE